MQLLFVVAGFGFFDLATDLLAAGLHILLVAFGDDGGGILGDGEAASLTQHIQLGVVQLEASVFGDHLTAGQHGDVFQHGLTTVAKARSLDSGHVQHTAQTVDHQGRQGFFFDVLGDDHQGTTGAGHLL